MKKSRDVLSVLGLTLVLSALPAFAQDARVEAAKKEGKVVWYTSLALPSAEKVAKLFEAAYPGIKVEVHRTGSQRILQRVMQELQANLKLIHTSDAGHFVLLKEKKLLMQYTPAGLDRFPAGFKDRDGYYYGLRATVNVIAYNTKLVSAGEAPKGWKDLLDPKWKGKLVTAQLAQNKLMARPVGGRPGGRGRLAKSGIIAAWCFIFIGVIRELSASIILFTPSTKVMSVVISDLKEGGSSAPSRCSAS